VGAPRAIFQRFKEADRIADQEWARQVHHQVYREVVLRQFGSWDESLQDRFFLDSWHKDPYKIIEKDGQRIGLVSVSEQTDYLFLHEIWIVDEFQGRGIGSELVQEVLAEAAARGKPVRLVVLLMNEAQRLYQRLGFRETGRTPIGIMMEWRDSVDLL
jgi:ribosomal protein S18 acetylase RimI-like enzyme